MNLLTIFDGLRFICICDGLWINLHEIYIIWPKTNMLLKIRKFADDTWWPRGPYIC
jgi:hypothetical protein